MRAADYAILALFILAIVAFAADRIGESIGNAINEQAERIDRAGH